MPHILGAGVAGAHDNLFGILHKPLCYAVHLVGHSGREHKHRAVLGNMAQDIVYGINKAHVQHFIGLVEHNSMHALELYHPAVDKIDKTSGGSNNNLHALPQGAYLAFDAAAAVHGKHHNIGHVLRKIGEVAGNLEA